VEEREDRFFIQETYAAEGREYTIRIIIHDNIPEGYSITYQRDHDIKEEHIVNAITHNITGNNKTFSAMWTNGRLEGHIQGEVTLGELRQMIDSIYEE